MSWDSRGLEIQASNSSLDQILHEVAAETGAKVEGLTKDQRIFGSYGPGPGCDVLSKLLDGADYNVLMIGSRDANAPLEIVLSARSAASEQTAQKNQNGSHSENGGGGKQLELEPQPDYASQALSPQPAQDPFNIGGAPRDPQQFMQEILQRQQSLDQQQEQQQKQDQSNHPQR